jgi:phosphatidylglycerophosphatase A
MIAVITTFFGAGRLRPAPGTWGSLAALPAALGLFYLVGLWGFLALTVAVFFIGWLATHIHTQGAEDHDPSYIVIDEVAGQWIALWPVMIGASHVGTDITALWPGWVAAFVFFRLFDITKPGPVGWADRRGDALGVMLDDVIAGVFAAVGVVILGGLSHAVM